MKRILSGAAAAAIVSAAGGLGTGVSAADTALIVGGTGPSPYSALQQLAAAYDYETMPPRIGEHYYDSATATREMISYPASVWPFSGPDSPPLGKSVATGANNLDAAIRSTDGPIVVPGLSQGSLVLASEQARLARDPNAPPPGKITFIYAGDPRALIWRVVPPGTHVPIADYTVQGPVESQYNTIEVASEYDAFADPPDRPQNLLADINALLGAQYYHTNTAFTDPASVAPEDVSVTTNSMGGTTTRYFVRSKQLPLAMALRDNGVPPEVTDQVDQALRPVVDAGYSRNDGPSSPPPALDATNSADLQGVLQQAGAMLPKLPKLPF